MGKPGFEVHCKFDEMLALDGLEDHPKNPNAHGDDQILRLSELYQYHGIRHPIIISKLSGKIVAGHGRKLAAIRAGMKDFPVVFQDFKNEEAEYAFMTADNAIADWSELDLSKINLELENLGPDFDINMLGISGFSLDAFNSDVDFPDLSGGKNEMEQMTFTLHKDQAALVQAAIDKASEEEDTDSPDNTNKPGNAIAFICGLYVNR